MSNIKLGQTFNVNGLYVPTKASVYLKPVGTFSLTESFVAASGASIDALNFSKAEQGNLKVIANDNIAGFTGNGFVQVISSLAVSGVFPSIYYPIYFESGTYHFWIRVYSVSGNLNINILLNNTIISTISDTITPSSWEWYYVTFDIPASGDAELSINILNELSIDKFYISQTYSVITGDGPDFTISPYITIHNKVYKTEEGIPTEELFIYNYLTTRINIFAEDWFNLNLKTLDDSELYWLGRYALVLFSSGNNVNRYIEWNTFDNNEYVYEPSLLKAT